MSRWIKFTMRGDKPAVVVRDWNDMKARRHRREYRNLTSVTINRVMKWCEKNKKRRMVYCADNPVILYLV